MQCVDASGVHFQQTTIRVTTRADIEKEPPVGFLRESTLRIRDEARHQE